MTGKTRSVSVAYDTRFEDLLALYRLALAKRHPRFQVVTGVLLCVAGLAVVASIVLGAYPALAAALVAILLLGLRLRTPERLARKRWRRKGGSLFEARLDSTGYSSTSAGQSIAIAWSAIQDIALRSDYLYLSAGEVDAVIALRALPPEWSPQALYAACLDWRSAAITEANPHPRASSQE